MLGGWGSSFHAAECDRTHVPRISDLPGERGFAVSSYCATVRWRRGANEDFANGAYSRTHQWAFDGGALIAASASPHHVPFGTADETAIDPEEALIAAISSCHMLFFLDYARRAGFIVNSYADDAVGFVEENERGKLAVTEVRLRPSISFSGDRKPTSIELEQLHQRCHEDCFVANSVKSKIIVETSDGKGRA